MTATAPHYILEHEAALTPGRVLLRQGPRTTIVTEADLIDLLKSVRRNATGVVRRAGITLDESQLVNLYDTYFPEQDAEDVEPDIDPDRYMHGGFVASGSTYDEHGTVWTPGQWPTVGVL